VEHPALITAGGSPMILRCPSCGDEDIWAQNKAFVSQRITLADDGSLTYEPWDTECVDFDGPEWYVCRSCGHHAEEVAEFKQSDGDFRIGLSAKGPLPDVDYVHTSEGVMPRSHAEARQREVS